MYKEEQKQLFEKIIGQHKGILFKVAHTYCQNETDRQDLIQEMLLQIWQSLHKYNNQFKISTWLYRISLNVAISFYRKNRTRINHYITFNEQPIQTENETKDEKELELLQQFISELKEIDKALIILYLENKNHSEIAKILGMTTSNVGTKVGRIKGKLRKRFLEHNKQQNGRS